MAGAASIPYFFVMAGQKREARLHPQVPAIHVFLFAASFKDVDARDKPGHDEVEVFWR
jgi:hypothetical protein